VFLHAPEAEIVFLVVVEIIDMDDLDVIRSAVAVIIATGRIACARTEVKEKVWGTAAEIRRGDPPDPSTGFYLVLERVSQEKYLFRGKNGGAEGSR